jgi:hypothetical protein
MTNAPELCVTFWHVALGNFPDGQFRCRTIVAEVAATLINDAKANGTALFASLEDIGAPYNKHEFDRTRELVDVLKDKFGINIEMQDFFTTPDDDGMSFILPLDILEIRPDRPLLVVTCAYQMEEEFSPDDLGLSVAADTVAFRLFEVG